MVSRNIDIPMDRIGGFCHRWKIREFSVFGSVLREDFGPDSDADVLVSFEAEAEWDLFHLGGDARRADGPVRAPGRPGRDGGSAQSISPPHNPGHTGRSSTMPREREDASLLWDMLQAARKIRQFIANKTFHEYSADEVLQSAVERRLEIVGEAAHGISAEFQQAHPEVPWRALTNCRNATMFSSVPASDTSSGTPANPLATD
jgi:uncharacterized protein with HEPN domain